VVTFDLACEDGRGTVTWIKVTAYDGMADVARIKTLRRGDYVVVGSARIVNRTLRGVQTCELRSEEFIIIKSRGDGGEADGESA